MVKKLGTRWFKIRDK